MLCANVSDGSMKIGKEIAGRILRQTSKIAGWFASLQNSRSRSASRNGSKRLLPLTNEIEGHIDEASLELLESDVVFADKFKVDQVVFLSCYFLPKYCLISLMCYTRYATTS